MIRAKKILCQMLALVMVLGSVTYRRAQEVQGADYLLKFDDTHVLDGEFYPTANRKTAGLENVLLSWPALTSGTQSMIGRSHILSYVYDADYTVEIDVKMLNINAAVVTYRQRNNALGTYRELVKESGGVYYGLRNVNHNNNLLVEEQLTTADMKGYTPILEGGKYTGLQYTLQRGNGDNPLMPEGLDFKLTDPDADIAEGPSDSLKTAVTEQVKLSWKGDGTTDATNIIYFQTDRAKDGQKIYSFYLNAPSTGEADEVHIASKFLDAIKGKPESDPVGQDVLNYENGDRAAQNPKAVFSFRLPLIWDTAGKVFRYVTAADGISLHIRKSDAWTNPITIPNIGQSVQAAQPVDFTYACNGSEGKLSMSFPASTIIANAEFNFDGKVHREEGNIIPKTMFYTHLDFEIVEKGTKFIAQIEPVYRDLKENSGKMLYRVYRKLQAGDTYEVIGSKSVDEMTEGALLDIELPTLEGPYYYMIEAQDMETGEVYRSQQMIYSMEGLDEPLKVPEDFTIIDEQTIAVDKDGNGITQTYAKIKFSLNTVNLVATKNLHPNLKEVFYKVLWHNLPKAVYSDLDEKAFTLRVNTTEAGPNFTVEALDENGVIMNYCTFNGAAEKIEGEVLVPVSSATVEGSKGLLYPKNYYASVRATANEERPGNVIANIAAEGWARETLLNINDITTAKVPVPQDAASENNVPGSFTVNFRTSVAELFRYMDYRMNPSKETLSADSVAYTIYLGENFDKMKALSDTLAQGQSPSGVTTLPDAGNTPSVDMSGRRVSLENGDIFSITWNSQAAFQPTEGMRKESYPYLDNAFTVTGANENTPIYALIVTKLYAYDTEWSVYTYVDGTTATQYGVPVIVGTGDDAQPIAIGGKKTTRHESDPSALLTITTKGDIPGPLPTDVEPPAPENFNDIEVGARSAELGWDVIDEIKLADEIFPRERIEYEILRIRGTALPAEFINNKKPIEDIETYLSANFPLYDRTAWRTQGAQPLLPELFNTLTSVNGLTHRQELGRHIILDGDLIPSNMYVYYIRTILKENDSDTGKPIKYSVWVPYSVSTTPVEKPLNLRSLRTGNFNSMTQALISFDAFVSRGDLESGHYELQYAIKKDDGDWSDGLTLANSGLVGGIVPLTDPEDYYNYEYLIKGLSPGSSYMIRVRVLDKRTGDLSMWSNVVTHRTMVDPDDPAEDIGKWEEYFKQQLEELLKRPYWKINDSTTSLEAVYRTSMFDGVIGSAENNVITLGQEKTGTQNYYIPIESVTKAVASNDGFKIVMEDVTLLIPSDVVTPGQSETLKNLVQKIKENTYRDYYIHIVVNTSATKDKIDGNDPVSDKIDLKITAVAFNQLERMWDAERLEASRAFIVDENMLTTNRSKISKKIKAGTTDEEMVKYIETLVEAVDKKIISANKTSFNSRKKTEFTLPQYEQPVRIMIANPDTDTEISGYRLVSGNWEKENTQAYGAGKSMLVTASGIYIFAGFTIHIPGLEGLPNSGAIKDVVIKYQLYDFFGASGSFNTEANLTNTALIGSVARMAGATTTQDPAAYLREKGITVSTRNSVSDATNETTVYLMMSLYEIKTGTKVSTVRITNQNILSAKGITGVNANYTPHYKVAYQSGIIEKTYQPKAQMQVKDFLEIIGRLAAKTNL